MQSRRGGGGERKFVLLLSAKERSLIDSMRSNGELAESMVDVAMEIQDKNRRSAEHNYVCMIDIGPVIPLEERGPALRVVGGTDC